ncbi:guanine nucleotide-binding protein G(s) subunit alpha [Hyalella azteca]|uniref:Guanine nucleotide-binding protein G(s) subunit alpha n=1 Tax=Hyalella azteca TaxID=294128 RepID=A0A8B7NJN9_HYAAZ|nr:guanine nucleotide-binding protein G(s) subunit alpha [Hyalella azteca]
MKLLCVQDPERAVSKAYDKQISEWKKTYDQAIKLLLLGAGESGKTTIIKQMKILHISGFSEDEKREKTLEIRRNVLDSIVTLCQNMEKVGCVLADPANEEALVQVLQCSINQPGKTMEETLDQKFYDNVAALWKDDGIQSTYAQQHKYQLIDCAKYFLDKLENLRDPSYEPSVQDILNSRKMTTDIQKIEFKTDIPKKYGGGKQTFWMFDVGGQKGERNKWIQVFDGIQAVLFLVATNSFDQMTREDDTTNRLEDSLDIFDNVWTSRFLQSAGFIIFLNKQDKLKEKVVTEKRSLSEHFPDFDKYEVNARDQVAGEDPEYLRARCYIRDLFIEITKRPMPDSVRRKISIAPGIKFNEEGGPKKECYPHFTTATDTDNVKLVFEDVHNMIILTNLSQIGMY